MVIQLKESIITNLNLSGLAVYSYLCTMKKEITIPEQMHRLKPEELEAATKRRENYSLTRDLQAREFNQAILLRLAKEKELELEKERDLQNEKKLEMEKAESSLVEGEKLIKCEKCGMEFSTGITMKGKMDCPECKHTIKIE